MMKSPQISMLLRQGNKQKGPMIIRSLNAGSSADHGAAALHALRNAQRVRELAHDHDDSGILKESSDDDAEFQVHLRPNLRGADATCRPPWTSF